VLKDLGTDAAKFKLLNENGVLFPLSNEAVFAAFSAMAIAGQDLSKEAMYSDSNGTLTYDTLKTAIEGSQGTATVYIIQGTINLTETISIPDGKHITLTVMDGLKATVNRANSSFQGSFFNVQGTNASLVLDAGGENGSLTLDGNNLSVGSPLVEVSGGKLTMDKRVTLKNNENNSSDSGGVWVFDGGTFTMNGGEISGNTVSGSGNTHGGGVFISDGSMFTMNGGTISGNTASGSAAHGGGVFISDGSVFTMNGGTISGNTASGSSSGNGGGVYTHGTGKFTMTGGIIYGANAYALWQNTAGGVGSSVGDNQNTVTSYP
jgi:hypothetical protein